MKTWIAVIGLSLSIGCNGADELAACPDGPLNTSDAPCACGEDNTFDPDDSYEDGLCECGFSASLLDCSGGDTDDTD